LFWKWQRGNCGPWPVSWRYHQIALDLKIHTRKKIKANDKTENPQLPDSPRLSSGGELKQVKQL